ncbi:MAG: HEAT repeat domain-containing protein [Promethearchaeota archaeon]|jgi:chromosome segregation protein
MSKELKDIINTVEKETKSRAELESIIAGLKEEINRLKFTIKEQQILIDEQGDQISFAQSDLPSEINILKEMITYQRQELIRRDQNIETLNDKLDQLKVNLEIPTDTRVSVQDDEALIKAQELILKLSEESEEYRTEIENLKGQLAQLKLERTELEASNQAQTEENEEMVNIKRLNFQLMEENGLLRVEVESLKSQIRQNKEDIISEELELADKKIEALTIEIDSLKNQMQEQIERVTSEEIELANQKVEALTTEIESLKIQMQEQIERVASEELELANKKVEDLTSEIKDYDAQLRFLQKELEESKEPAIISTEDALQYTELREDYENLRSELIAIQKENEDLKNRLSNLSTDTVKMIEIDSSTQSVAYDFPKHFQISLFKKMYNLLDDNNKKALIDTLINDLNSKNNEVKRTAIRILSEIKDKRVRDAFFDLIHDKDWLIRYNLIKALRRFNFEAEEFKELLKRLTKDADVDVRELAIKVLNEISK